MNNRDVIQRVILTPMQSAYLPPTPAMSLEQRTTALEVYFLALRDFDGATLEKAWAQSVSTQPGREWGVAGIMAEAARRSRRERRDEIVQRKNREDVQSEREAYWHDTCVRSAKARWAAKNGVAQALYLAIVDDN